MARRGKPAKEVFETLKEQKARTHRGSGKLIEPVILGAAERESFSWMGFAKQDEQYEDY